jgi:hypothetical protein
MRAFTTEHAEAALSSLVRIGANVTGPVCSWVVALVVLGALETGEDAKSNCAYTNQCDEAWRLPLDRLAGSELTTNSDARNRQKHDSEEVEGGARRRHLFCEA